MKRSTQKALNLLLLLCGLACSLFLLIEAVPSFPNLTEPGDTFIKFLVIVEAILLIVLPILSYFPNLRTADIVLAIILVALLLLKWQHLFSIIFIIYSLLIIGFNIYLKQKKA